MAEAALFEIAAGIITKLGSLAVEQVGLWWDVKDEFERLTMTVSAIQAVLLDAEEKYSKNHQVKNWVNLLKEAFYDIDDLLDDFSTRSLQEQVMSSSRKMKKVCIFFSSSNQFAYGLKMARKTKAIRSKLDAIVATKNFHLDRRSEGPMDMADERETHSSLPEVVVGRDDDKMVIIEFLLSPNYRENVSVISIVGIGGLGKTTLAQLVWDDEKVKSHFELKLWAWVSDKFNVKQIIEKILESVEGKKPENLEINTLKDKLHEKIKEKRYLLVLDDVWNENTDKWFNLKDLLAVGDEGSRIIVTTRQKNIAQMIRSDSIYDLQGLDDSESWTLFKEMAFEHGQEPSLECEKVGKDIAAKCVGVPLAIRSIGRLLYSKNLSEWLSIRDKQLSDMTENEISILPILKLSYDHLPSHLKHCFAYCRLFPKGCKIGVPFLVQNWIAQGYIKPPDTKKCLEETSLEYFKNLLWRSFFQEVEEDDFGSIKWCKMHNLIHDLADFVAGEESCQLDLKGDQLVEGIKAGTRHLWIDFKGGSPRKILRILSRDGDKKFRSLYLWNRRETEEGDIHAIFSISKCLRALTLSNMGIDRVPSSIRKMKHLRYLSLAHNTRIAILPNSLTELPNLQVLDLDGCERLKQLPKDIRKLINLTHLYLWGCNSLINMPHGLGELTSLQHLSRFTLAEDNEISKHCGGLGELRDLNNISGLLRILNLQYVKNPQSVFAAANLKEKQHLRSCYFAWKLGPQSDGDIEDGNGPDDEILSLEELCPHVNLRSLGVFGCGRLEFPKWVSSLFNLVNLDIRNCKNCHLCPPLDQLPFLKNLGLHGLTDMEYMESQMNCENKPFFPSLESLWLKNCQNLKGWGRHASRPDLPQFHCLKYLEIDSCPNLTSMPQFPSVEKLVPRNSSIKSLEDMLNIKDHAIPLPSLKAMTIDACDDEYDENGMLWQCLVGLQNLVIRNMSKLISLPKGLQHVHTLHRLLIESCPNLMHMPEWISTLQYLEIENCPQLSERCGNNRGADWLKISHIPNIRIEGTWIQYDGCYTL